jgi:hypothetical protein
MDRYSTLSSPNIKNLVSSFINGNFGCGPLDNILQLKKECTYDYIQNSVLPRHGSSKVHFFKMATKGEGSGIDLVVCM